MNQKIRIKLKSFDHNLVDKSAEKIVKTVRSQDNKSLQEILLPTHIVSSHPDLMIHALVNQ